MKRKVKAQRKFAQGTIVPAVNNMNINLFPKNDTGTTPQEENIIVNKMSARNLLDIISIQGVLPQLKERPLKSAYVRIERLNSKKAANEKNQRKPGPSPIIKTPVEQNSENYQSKRTITLRRFSKYSGVSLRSRVHKNIKNNKSKTTPQTFRTSNRTITKNKCYCSLYNRSHDSVCSSVCMDDDDKPLIAFTKIGMNGEKSPLESASCNGVSTAQCYGASNPRTLRNTETKTDRRLRRMSGLIKFDRTPKQPLNKAKASTDVPPGTASISPKEKAVKSPQATVKSPQATVKSPQATVKSPQATVKSPQATVKSPQATVKSLQAKVKSPQATVKSPQATVKSPQATVKSPQVTTKSPQATVKSPQATVKSPQAVAKGKKPIEKRRSKDIVTPKEKLLRKKSALQTAKRFRALPPTSSAESLQTPQAGLSNAILPGLHVCASPIPDRSDAMPDDEDLQSEYMEGQSIFPTLEALKESIAKKEESRAGRVSPQSAPSYSTYLEYGGENASPVPVASNAHTRQDVQESASPQTEPLQVYKMPARSSPQPGPSIGSNQRNSLPSPRPKRTRTATKNKLQAKQNTRSATASKNPSQVIKTREIESPITFQEIQPCVISNNDSVNANLQEGAPHTANISSTKTKLYDTHNIINWIDGEFKVPDPPSRISTSRAQEKSSAPKENDVDVYSTASTCASERYSSVLDVAQAPEAELSKGCGSCSCCRRVNKALQLKSLLQRRLMTPDIYEFDGNDEQEGLQPFRSSREEGAQQTGNSENVYIVQCIHSWEHDNELFKIIITERDGKKRCTAYRVPRSSTKNIRKLLLIEDELAIDQMVDDLSAESELIQPNPDKSQENTSVDPEPTTITPIPKPQSLGKVIDAIVYRPTEAEFLDPLAYFEKIMPTASKFGICKVIPPPGFKPDCKITNDFRFTVTNQYLARLYCRWGPVARETAAIKAYLATQAVYFSKCPLIDGLEVDLPKFYHTVQRQGGLQTVIQNKCWDSVAEEMLLMNNITNPDKKLDNIYVKYLVPYTYLSDKERNEMIAMVEKKWNLKYSKMLERARNPLHRQKRILQESESSDSESEYEDNFSYAINEAEECVVSGRKMTPGTFKKFAGNIMRAHYPAGTQTVKKIEEDYWRYVICGVDHVCVNSASIDTGEEGYGFTKIAAEPYGKHPWNLKMLSRNDKNVLRSLGPILGVTVPTLHVNMLFSTSCWHSDPQGLPWVEYHHQGAPKIWYGIPSSESEVFRAAVEKLCPYSCQNKSIWLPSDITMIPPNILCENKVSLSRVEQHPGEFIIVFPKAYSCSISTGYAISESVYFATNSWLNSVHQVYQELRDSSEPTMFPLEHLLLSVAQDPKTPISILQQVHANLIDIVEKEFDHRLALQRLPARVEPRLDSRRRPSNFAWNVRDLDECEICKTPLYLAKVLGITGKREPLCLEHAKRILNTPHYANIDLRRVVLIIYFSTQELNAIVEKVRKRLLT